jgi:hypothetical protein
MPTRKQRRRRQKGLRHEYEYVYVDEEGRELEVDADAVEERSSRRNGKRDAKRPAQKSSKGKPVRPVAPPSWRRVGKRALLFGPLIFVAFSVIDTGQSIAVRLATAVVYTAFFVPLMYLMDRTMYRTYLRRTGQDSPQRPSRKR